MGKGIIGMIGLAVTLAFALPIALFGLDRLVGGETVIGAAALGIAVLMVVLEEYLTTPSDIPGKAAEKVAETVVKEPEDPDE